MCPWCYIGKRRFESALARFEHADEVEVRWRSFELDPRAPGRRAGDMAAHLAGKYGMTLEQARARLAGMDELAAAEGLDYNLAETKGGNTFDAHRLIHLGEEHGIGGQVKEGLLHAYFVDLQSVSEPACCSRWGSGRSRSDRGGGTAGRGPLRQAVRADEAEAAESGRHRSPVFRVRRAFAVPGAQDSEVFLSVLGQAWGRSHPPVMVRAEGQGPGCTGDACRV